MVFKAFYCSKAFFYPGTKLFVAVIQFVVLFAFCQQHGKILFVAYKSSKVFGKGNKSLLRRVYYIACRMNIYIFIARTKVLSL